MPIKFILNNMRMFKVPSIVFKVSIYFLRADFKNI